MLEGATTILFVVLAVYLPGRLCHAIASAVLRRLRARTTVGHTVAWCLIACGLSSTLTWAITTHAFDFGGLHGARRIAATLALVVVVAVWLGLLAAVIRVPPEAITASIDGFTTGSHHFARYVFIGLGILTCITAWAYFMLVRG